MYIVSFDPFMASLMEIEYCGNKKWKANVDQKQEQIDLIICKSAFNNLYFGKFPTKLLE